MRQEIQLNRSTTKHNILGSFLIPANRVTKETRLDGFSQTTS